MSVSLQKDNTIATIIFNMPDSKVNLLTAEVLKQLDGILDELTGAEGIKALVIKSNKPDIFIAGADIKEIEAITDPKEGESKARAGQDILNKLEDLPMPTIAVIDGVALGGGCELALACTYRLGTFNEKLRIGLPEVNLGILPGFGGTYRMPRTVGLAEGLKMILSAKPIDGRKAHKIGLFDRLMPRAGLDESVQEFVNEIAESDGPKYRPRKKRGLLGLLESNRLGHQVIFSQSKKNVLKASKGFYPAPLKALDVIKKNYYTGRDEGMAIERKGFGELVITDVSKNLIKVFYLSEKYKKLTLEDAKDIVPQPIDKAGILGAGIMGGGIAQLLSYKDIWVRLKDINFEALKSGLQAARKVFAEAVRRRKLEKARMERKMAMITTTLDYSGFADCDIVIEAVLEDIKVKEKVFKELSENVDARTILATNTSALSVEAMAAQTRDPSKVVGFHFFNPVHRMPLLEVIKAPQTSDETIISALALAKRLSKIPVLVKDSCGFLVNRILLNYINETGYLLEETGDVEAVDKAALQFGMPMGPFLLSDEVGLDVGIKVMHILEEGFGERFKPAKIYDRVIEAGLLGKKNGRGFYLHQKGKRAKLNPVIATLLPNVHYPDFDRDMAQKRLIYVMINEAARCLEDGIIDGPSTVDAGMIFGTGFPPFRGGLLRYADGAGIKEIVETLDALSNTCQTNRLRPCERLRKMAQNDERFYQ